jgi:CheY-like chemotaxis protein
MLLRRRSNGLGSRGAQGEFVMLHVLVVEDDALVRASVCDLLEGAGFACEEAADAAAALALLEGRDCAPDVLVTDFDLGPGPDGKALAREAQRRLPGLPTVFVTADPEGFADHPFGVWERFLAKPFSGADLVAAILGLRPANDLGRAAGAAAAGHTRVAVAAAA